VATSCPLCQRPRLQVKLYLVSSAAYQHDDPVPVLVPGDLAAASCGVTSAGGAAAMSCVPCLPPRLRNDSAIVNSVGQQHREKDSELDWGISNGTRQLEGTAAAQPQHGRLPVALNDLELL